MNEYVAHLSFRNPTFAIADIIGTAQTYSVAIELGEKLQIGKDPETFFVKLKFPTDEDAALVASHCISIRSISRYWFSAKKFSDILEFCEKHEHNINDGTFAIRIETQNKKLKHEQSLEYINQLISALKITSKVDIKNAKTKLMLFIEFDSDVQKQEEPKFIYIGTKLCEGIPDFPDQFTLKKRKFINKTSMEAALAIHSAVQGLASKGKIIYDPFCGSGSLMVACASLGAYVFGSDLDFGAMTVQGYKEEKKTSVYSNFEQYNLKKNFLGLIQTDFLKDMIRNTQLDAIVTDPPYGIRERAVADSELSPLCPLLLHLYEFAAKHLKVGGRLVYWLPCGYDLDTDKDLPKHPALKLISNCQQHLTSRYCRHLITLEKTANINAKVEFSNYEASWLKVYQLVFAPNEVKDRKERKKNLKEKKRIERQKNKPE